jgi:gluconate 2-dehydrogenase gamma chain
MTNNKENQINSNRRDALKTLTLLTGYAMTAGAASAFLAGCKADPKGATLPDGTRGKATYTSIFSNEQMSTIAEIAERIIPKTDSPGAKEAGVADYISQTVNLFYKKEDQTKFLEKLASFDKAANDKYKKTFVQLSDENKDDVLKIMVAEWKKNDKEYHIFKDLRDLTVTGFCTSELGAKKFLTYEPVPGPYKIIDRNTVKAGYSL